MQEDDILSCWWLLSQLYACFEGNIEVQKRYGTLVYHKHCGLIHALTTALAQNDKPQHSLSVSTTCDNTCSSHTCSTLSIEEQTGNVALFLNSKLHERARLCIAAFDENPESIASIDIASALASTDPPLMSFLSTLTQSVRQSKHRLFSDTSGFKSVSPSNISPSNSRLF